jgi:hypothetical protein
VLCISKPQGSQLGAVISAANSPAGWRADAFKVIIVITESMFGEGGTYAVRADVRTALLNLNAVPIFITPSTVQAAYAQLTSDIGFGVSSTMLSSWSNAYSLAFTSLRSALATIWAIPNDPQNLVQSIITPASGIIAPAVGIVNVTLMNANQSLTSLSDITVRIIGWGIATITPQVNQAPVTSVVSVTTREDIGANIPLNGTDVDGDSLTVTIETLPTKGKLYVSSNNLTLIAANSTFNLPDGTNIPYIYYVPNLHYNGSDLFRWHLNDGCTNSASANATVTITYYNYPPVATSASTSTNENTNLSIQLKVSDVEDSMALLVSFIRSLPDASLATLYHINNNSAVQLNDQLAASVNHTVRYAPKLYACCDTSTFSFQVRDTGNQFSDILLHSFTLTHFF